MNLAGTLVVRPPYPLLLLPGPDDFIVTVSYAFGAQLAVWAF
jgi:hypothetical protein